jgi:hypothetical protein
LGKIESDSWTYRITKDTPLILTSRKGRRPRRRLSANNSCESNPLFSINRLLPFFIKKVFNIPKVGCHKIELEYQEANSNNRRKIKYLNLKISRNGSSEVDQLKGTFSPSIGIKTNLKGPGVFTKYTSGNRQRWLRLTLDKNLPDTPLTGQFIYNKVAYPAKVSSNKGLILEIYIPQKRKWWTLKTSHNY